MAKPNTGVLWSVDQTLGKGDKTKAQNNMGLDTLYSGANTDEPIKYVKRVYQDSDGKIVTVQSDTNSYFTYNDPGTAPINGVGVKSAIDSITVKVDDDTAALNRLMVTSKENDAILGESFYSGLKKVSPSGYEKYSYVSVNCGEGLYISSRIHVGTPGELRLSEATSSTYGGIKIGYSSDGDNYAVQLDPTSKKAYVNVPWSDTKNTVGVGSTNPAANEVFVFPFVRSNSGTSQQSYTQLSAVNLLSVSETSDAVDYLLNFNGYAIPKVNVSSVTNYSLLTYDELSGQLIKAAQCGNSTTPIYLDSLGCPTACSIVQPFALNRGASNNYGDQLELSSTNNTYGAAVKVRKDSGETAIFWPGSSTPQDPTIGYLAPRIGSSDGGKFLGVNSSDNTVRWLDVPQKMVIGEETTITTGYIWVPHYYNGIIFGDGFEFTSTPAGYNCYSVQDNMGVMEGMSITYALTGLAESTNASTACEFYNKNRLLNPSGTGHYYDTVQLYRTGTAGSSTSTSYIATSSLPTGGYQMDLAVVPPHHFLWMHVMINWYLDAGGNPFSDNDVYISISLQDTAGSNNHQGCGDPRCLVDSYERGVSSDNCKYYRPNYSFIAYNNSDENKYIHYYQGAASQLGATIYKQMILFKAPGYGALDQPKMN